jgi:undecaprenyl-phosphate galactose phosphotransferase
MEITREIEASRKPLYDRAKRLFDVVVGGILLIATSPLFFIIALLVKLTSRGPVFYRQTRLGKDGRAFRVYKFRTMVADADNYLREWLSKNPALRREFEEYFKLKNDPRVTPVGRLLRKASLDELPQLINVMRGEMHLVGPRPIVREEVRYYEPYEGVLFSVKPGITGLWQVSGRNNIPYSERVKMDIGYIRRRNFFLDMWILIKTFKIIFTGHGAY